jgi:hypothetical protein
MVATPIGHREPMGAVLRFTGSGTSYLHIAINDGAPDKAQVINMAKSLIAKPGEWITEVLTVANDPAEERLHPAQRWMLGGLLVLVGRRQWQMSALEIFWDQLDYKHGMVWPIRIVVLEYKVEVLCRDLAMVSCALVHAIGNMSHGN